MIIKRNKKNPPRTASTGAGTITDTTGTSRTSSPKQEPWSLEAMEVGEVQERRMADRRRSYRRIEDKTLISRASEEANAIRENAQQEGFDEGMAQAQETLAELRESIAQLLTAKDEALLSIADQIAPIAVEIAERIIKTEVTCDETLIMSLVRDTIQKVGRTNKNILIKVHPTDTRLVKDSLKANPIPNLNAELIVMDDPMVDQGSCILETNSGLIDASFSTQLEILKHLFGGSTTPDASSASEQQEF